ncbi:MAG: hypothetical protein CMI17_05055 [Opitutaceae bacterium]|nr:hypothetical protein [Opitutaceae bacterium]
MSSESVFRQKNSWKKDNANRFDYLPFSISIFLQLSQPILDFQQHRKDKRLRHSFSNNAETLNRLEAPTETSRSA